jgi:Phosphotransferase enzyme family
VAPRRYAHVPSARRPRAAFDVDSGPAARFCAALVSQSFRHGLPASKPLGRLRAATARSGLAARVPPSLLRRFPKRSRPDVDRVAEIVDPELRALALHRRTALTVFLFSDAVFPQVVAKLPGDSKRLERDVEALRRAEPAGAAPRFLGRAGDAYLQEALPGLAMAIEPVTLENAPGLVWRGEHEDVAEALVRLAAATATDAVPVQLAEPFDADDVRVETRRAIAAAARDLRGLRRAVLTHSDTSPHNCICTGGRLSGFVDWEGARLHGAPGFDVWNHAVSYLEHGLGLVNWSEEIVAAAFAAAWPGRFFAEARRAARRAAAAAGVQDGLHDALEVAFFARRLLVRVRYPRRFPTGVSSAARMLEVVCGR